MLTLAKPLIASFGLVTVLVRGRSSTIRCRVLAEAGGAVQVWIAQRRHHSVQPLSLMATDTRAGVCS